MDKKGIVKKIGREPTIEEFAAHPALQHVTQGLFSTRHFRKTGRAET